MTKSAENTTEAPKKDPPTPDKSNQPTQTGVNTQSTTPVTGLAASKPDPDAKTTEPSNDVADKDKDPPPEISGAEQAELDKLLDSPEHIDAATTQPVNDSVRKLFKLLAGIPADTPDEHPVWGAAGVSLNIGDLRNLAKAID